MWQVPYAPGELKAHCLSRWQARRRHRNQNRRRARASGAGAGRTAIAADGDDLSFVTVRVEDKDGNICPLADNLVKFALAGPGKIAGVDNGNAATVEPFQADYRKAFNGLALVIVARRTRQGGARQDHRHG